MQYLPSSRNVYSKISNRGFPRNSAETNKLRLRWTFVLHTLRSNELLANTMNNITWVFEENICGWCLSWIYPFIQKMYTEFTMTSLRNPSINFRFNFVVYLHRIQFACVLEICESWLKCIRKPLRKSWDGIFPIFTLCHLFYFSQSFFCNFISTLILTESLFKIAWKYISPEWNPA